MRSKALADRGEVRALGPPGSAPVNIGHDMDIAVADPVDPVTHM